MQGYAVSDFFPCLKIANNVYFLWQLDSLLSDLIKTFIFYWSVLRFFVYMIYHTYDNQMEKYIYTAYLILCSQYVPSDIMSIVLIYMCNLIFHVSSV